MALIPPINFGMVENSIFRSAWPSELNYPFIKSIGIKMIISLSGDPVSDKFAKLLADDEIRLVEVADANKSSMGGPLTTLSEEMATQTLRILMNEDNLPALIVCHTGTVQTGIVVGCLRKLRKWSMISIFEEYRRFCGTKMQQENEQFVELFDNDLIVQMPSPRDGVAVASGGGMQGRAGSVLVGSKKI